LTIAEFNIKQESENLIKSEQFSYFCRHPM